MKRIAVLEDDQDYREVLTKSLENAGYEVIGASTGFEMVQDIIEKEPDLILLDLMLPMVDGNKVVDLFKEKEMIKDVPVIVISSKDESEIKKAAEGMNAVGWFQKPVDDTELINAINQHIK